MVKYENEENGIKNMETVSKLLLLQSIGLFGSIRAHFFHDNEQ